MIELYDPKAYLGDAEHLRNQAVRSRKNAERFERMAELAAEFEERDRQEKSCIQGIGDTGK